ncbi:hypothetical protein V6N13_029795 [Hibiscus sabdariffa]
MKDGFKVGCRPIIGLDGCHLKGYYQDHLLAAVGIDADDSIYPISFAVVESENQSSWCWFLELLATDLEIENSHGFTFMTYRQKGLMDVVPELFPYSAHRTCVRHLYSNAKTSGVFIGKALKDQLWKAARATYVTQFQSTMDELKVSCGPSSQHSVNIQERTCSCRKWQLTVILSIEDRPEKYVDSCYSVSTQRAIYSHLISPVRGEQQWATNDTMEPILPPMFRRPSGRPHKKRKREADEAPPTTGKLKRHGPRTTPTSQATTTQIPGSTSIEPTQPNIFRWMSTPTVRTSQESSISHSSPSPTPLPTQASHSNVFSWMPTPGVPLSQDNSGSHLSQNPTPTPKPPSQDNCGSQSSPRIDP